MAEGDRQILSPQDCWAIWGGHDRRSGTAIVMGWSVEVETDERGDFRIIREFDPEKEKQTFEVDVTFVVRAASAEEAWQQVYDAIQKADDSDGGRREGNLPPWEMREEAATAV